jgi:hypothetical protein
MIREHEARRKAAGEPPAFYFFDIFCLNQHQLFKDCTSDEAARLQLVTSLRNCLIACGNLLLCCGPGSCDNAEGWESPAVLTRIWCLFEVFVALKEDIEITIQFGRSDERAFRIALEKGGPARIQTALSAIRVAEENSSVESDKHLILAEIEATTGIGEFDALVRAGLASEYRRISATGIARRAMSGA